jgi:hypothetical protein
MEHGYKASTCSSKYEQVTQMPAKDKTQAVGYLKIRGGKQSPSTNPSQLREV